MIGLYFLARSSYGIRKSSSFDSKIIAYFGEPGSAMLAYQIYDDVTHRIALAIKLALKAFGIHLKRFLRQSNYFADGKIKSSFPRAYDDRT